MVEYKLPKLGVASSSLVARSNRFLEGKQALVSLEIVLQREPVFLGNGRKVGFDPLFFLSEVGPV